MKKLSSASQVKKFWWTQTQAYTFCKVDAKTFRKWGIEPVAAFNKSKYYDSMSVINFFLEKELKERVVQGESGEYVDIQDEQAKKTRQERIKLELANAKTMREQAPVELLTFALDDLISQFVAVLDGLPLTVKREIPDIPGVALDVVDREIAKARNIMADANIDFNRLDK